ncbi:hypothetical protein C8R44DRAFT_729154 [Mycena epipterygia]|nr:hypothetical protein C8R44DRAFT_729154 [Mycena epipterygia]
MPPYAGKVSRTGRVLPILGDPDGKMSWKRRLYLGLHNTEFVQDLLLESPVPLELIPTWLESGNNICYAEHEYSPDFLLFPFDLHCQCRSLSLSEIPPSLSSDMPPAIANDPANALSTVTTSIGSIVSTTSAWYSQAKIWIPSVIFIALSAVLWIAWVLPPRLMRAVKDLNDELIDLQKCDELKPFLEAEVEALKEAAALAQAQAAGVDLQGRPVETPMETSGKVESTAEKLDGTWGRVAEDFCSALLIRWYFDAGSFWVTLWCRYTLGARTKNQAICEVQITVTLATVFFFNLKLALAVFLE